MYYIRMPHVQHAFFKNRFYSRHLCRLVASYCVYEDVEEFHHDMIFVRENIETFPSGNNNSR